MSNIEKLIGYTTSNHMIKHVLEVLESKGRIPEEKAGKLTRIPKPAFKKIISELIEKGMVDVEEEEDGRNLLLTETGREVILRLFKV